MAPFWKQDSFIDAFMFAADAHNGQMLPGSVRPYIVHVTLVCTELMTLQGDGIDGDYLLRCAALHDTLEDTHTTYSELVSRFGTRVADGVSALTKDRSLEKTDQLQDSLRRIVGSPREIWMVKMADRISNLLHPPSTWPIDRITAYHRDARVIHAALRDANGELASRLEERIGGYSAYV